MDFLYAPEHCQELRNHYFPKQSYIHFQLALLKDNLNHFFYNTLYYKDLYLILKYFFEKIYNILRTVQFHIHNQYSSYQGILKKGVNK